MYTYYTPALLNMCSQCNSLPFHTIRFSQRHNRFLEVSVKQSNYIFTTTTRISSSTNFLQINLSIFTNNELLLDTIHLITTMLLCLNYNTRMHLESNHVSIKLD